MRVKPLSSILILSILVPTAMAAGTKEQSGNSRGRGFHLDAIAQPSTPSFCTKHAAIAVRVFSAKPLTLLLFSKSSGSPRDCKVLQIFPLFLYLKLWSG